MARIERKRFYSLNKMRGQSWVKKLKKFINEYYKKLFGAPALNYITVIEEVTHHISQL
jgi:hypothetical protein